MADAVGALTVILGLRDDASGPLDAANKKIESNTERTTESIISKWTAVGLAVTGAAYAAGLAVDAYNEKTAHVEAINARTGDSFSLISDGLQAMSNRYDGVQELSRIADQLSKIGPASESSLLTATKSVNSLAHSINAPGDAVATSLLPAMAAFNVGVDGVSSKVDGLSYLFNNSSLDIGEWGASMARSAPLAARLGLSLDDMDSALLILAERGYSGRSMIAAINNALDAAGTAAGEAQDKFDQASDKVQNLTDRMSLLSDTASDLSLRLTDAKDTLKDLNTELEQGPNIDDYRDKLTDLQDTGVSLQDRLTDTAATISDLRQKIALKEGGAADTSGSRQRFDNSVDTEPLEKLQRELTKAEHEYTQIEHQIDRNNKAQKEAANVIASGTTPEYERLQKQQKNVREQVDSLTHDIEKNNNEMSKTGTQLSEAKTEQAKYAQALKDTADPQAVFLGHLHITNTELATHKQLLADSAGYAEKMGEIYEKITPTSKQSENLAGNAAAAGAAPVADVQNNTGLLSGVIISGTALSAMNAAIDLYKLLGRSAGGAGTAVRGVGVAAEAAAPEIEAGLSAAIDATSAAETASMAAVSSAEAPMAAAIEAQSAFEALGTSAATGGAIAGTTLAASIGGGLLAGLAGVRIMAETGILSALANAGKAIESENPAIAAAAKILFAPIGIVGAVSIDAATLQFSKIPGDIMSVAGQASNAAHALGGGIVGGMQLALGALPDILSSGLSAANTKIGQFYALFKQSGIILIGSLVTGMESAFSSGLAAITTWLGKISDLLPHSPAKTGPLSYVPNWDALLSEPIDRASSSAEGSARSMAASVSDSLRVQPATISPSVSTGSSQSVTQHFAGDTITIQNPTFRNTDDIDYLFQQFEERQRLNLRRRGYRA